MTTPYKLHSYQQALLDKVSGGFRARELMVFSAGRASGKSMLNAMYVKLMEQTLPKFQIANQAEVDGATWYTIACVPEVSEWIREHPKELQYAHVDKTWTIYQNWFDIHEELCSMLTLRWA